MSGLPEISEEPIEPIINHIDCHMEKCDTEKEFDEDNCPCPPASVINFGEFCIFLSIL